jgi:hypothetical protein
MKRQSTCSDRSYLFIFLEYKEVILEFSFKKGGERQDIEGRGGEGGGHMTAGLGEKPLSREFHCND